MQAGHTARADFSVPTIDCEGCARTIKRALGQVEGIGTVDMDVRARRVCVEYEPDRLDEARVRDALERAGFVVE